MSDGLKPIASPMDEIRKRIARLNGGRDPDLRAAPAVSVDGLIAASKRREIEAHQRIVRDLSSVPERFARETFATFREVPENAAALRAARAVISSGFTSGAGFFGPPSRGKTHLASAIANAAISLGRVAIVATTTRILSRIRECYGADRNGERRGESERRLIENYAAVPLLAIDDLGKESLSRWSLTTLFEIANRRSELGLPLVVTANLSPAGLAERYADPRDERGALIRGVDPFIGEAIIERVFGMTGMPWHSVGGAPMRWGIDRADADEREHLDDAPEPAAVRTGRDAAHDRKRIV